MLAVILIVSNILLDRYSLIINRFLVGDTADSSGAETQDALQEADKVVRKAAEESIVLLKNDNDFLPLQNLNKVNLFGWGSTDAGMLLTGGGNGEEKVNAATDEYDVILQKFGRLRTQAGEKYSFEDGRTLESIISIKLMAD